MNIAGILKNFANQEILNDTEAKINSFSVRIVLLSSLALIILLFVASKLKNKNEKVKTPLFAAIAALVLIPTLSLLGSTVYLNTISDSGGPVHWHTDFEVWACGQELELRDPSGFLSNKIGSATFHEHNDKRIHLEGVIVEKEYDASLGKFMELVDGNISTDQISFPVEETLFTDKKDGDQATGNEADVRALITEDAEGKAVFTADNTKTCGGSSSEVQAFLYRYDEATSTYSQTRLDDPAAYVLRDESVVPPGDCLIIEFSPYKDRTDKLCQQYGVRDEEQCVDFGVSSFNPKLCNIRQTRATSGGSE